MSIKLVTACRDRLAVSEGELLVAIELADAANDFGEAISVGVDRIADRSRQHPRTVKRCLKRLRDVAWLEVVGEGGIRGGRGQVTLYRINPAWIRGDILPGFPDYVPQHCERLKAAHATRGNIQPQALAGSERNGDSAPPLSAEVAQKKGDKLPPFEKERVTNGALKGDKSGVKGDTALSPDPLTHIPSGGAPSAGEPSGPSPGAPETKPPNTAVGEKLPPRADFDPVARLAYWYSTALNRLTADAKLFGWSQDVVARLPERARQLASQAVEQESEVTTTKISVKYRAIEDWLSAELRHPLPKPAPARDELLDVKFPDEQRAVA